MTQSVFVDIDPNVKSGTELATDLNNFKESLLTQHSGGSSPTYAEVGTEWLDTAIANSLTKKIYDGAQWVTINTVDTIGHSIFYGGNNPTASFSIKRTDDAADMLELFRDTVLTADAGIVFTQNNDAAVKKTMANIKMVSDTIANGAEDASLSFEGMKSGTLTELFSVSKTTMFADFLQGIGKRSLIADASGNVSTEAIVDGDNLFSNGKADTGDDSAYTATGLTFTKSSTASELIEGSEVFKAVSSTNNETLVTEGIDLKNAHIGHPIIVSLKYHCAFDWDIEILNQSDTPLVSEVISSFTQEENEANNKKLFIVIGSGTTQVKVRFTSSAADTLLFDDLQVYSLISRDEPLYFERNINNNATGNTLFNVFRTKNSAYRINAKIVRETDINYAEALVEFFVSYDSNGAAWRVAKETVTDLEDLETEIDFSVTGNTLQYDSSAIAGLSYAGKINGTITRIL